MRTPEAHSPAQEQEEESQEYSQSKFDLLKAFFYCLIVVTAVRFFIVEPFRIPSSSMVPTLKIGDHIFVSKFTYGLTLPFTKYQFLKIANPKRGDVIVFLWPRDESLHYVKRVIGLPGDKIEIAGQNVYVNNSLLRKEEVRDAKKVAEIMDTLPVPGKIYTEYFEGAPHYIRHSEEDLVGMSRHHFLETVPPNQYFVMGDNRDDSSDSRSWGFVPRENIQGRAEMIWLSIIQGDERGSEPGNDWNVVQKIRWNRVTQLIH